MPHALPPRAFAMPLTPRLQLPRPRWPRPRLQRLALPAGLARLLPAGLARRFGLAMVGLVGVLLVGTGAVNMWVTYAEATAGAVQVQREKAQAAAERVAQFIEAIESQVGWTTRAEWARVSPEQRRYDFIRLQRQVPAITDLQYIDGNGREQLRLSRLEPDVVGSGQDFSADPLFSRAVAERSWRGPVYFRRGSEPYMTLSLAHVGRMPGVTAASVNLKLIWDVVTAIRIGQAGYAYVTDAAGRLVAHPDMSLVLRETDLSRLPQVARAIANGDATPTTVLGPDGRHVLSAHAAIPQLGWIVFVELPRREVLAPVWASLVQTLVLLGFGVLLALLLGGWLARRMVGPIRLLQASAQRLGEGDLGQRISLESQDEIGALARRFNAMAGRIQEAQETLEAKVVDRTQAVTQRTAELQEALEQQTATAEVLRLISSTTYDLEPVFQKLVETAARLCQSDRTAVLLVEQGRFRAETAVGFPAAFGVLVKRIADDVASFEGMAALPRAVRERRVIHYEDIAAMPGYPRAPIELGQQRTVLALPLLRDGVAAGAMILSRTSVAPFTERQIALAGSFADQAAIAVENVRLLAELREALARQTATAEVLAAINANPGQLEPVFSTILDKAHALCGAEVGALFLVEGDEMQAMVAHGYPPHITAELMTRLRTGGRSERLRAGERLVHTLDLAAEALPGTLDALVAGCGVRTSMVVPLREGDRLLGWITANRLRMQAYSEAEIGLLESFAAQAVLAVQNARLLAELRERTAEAEHALDDLRLAQDRLVQTEKLASLGQLTAGIAHEIKNPLNFVNNFASLSAELVQELADALTAAGEAVPPALREEVTELADMLRGNLEKVVQHGQRADSIVRNMLAHSREGGGERRQVALNPLVEEAMNLAWHGARAEKPGLNVTLEKAFDAAAGDAALFPQEFTRVLLNLVGNAVYATAQRGLRGEPGYEPTVRVGTRALGDSVEVTVRDNGTGIPEAMRKRIFEPFFTTKPAGEGTGLGLSLSHDIVVKQHGGSFTVESQEGAFTEFRVLVPRIARETMGEA